MFTVDKKKALCSSKHSIQEHDDEILDADNREIKTNNEIYLDEIHTINDWEHADLGDEQRKQKFLRLMGVKKRKDSQESHPDEECLSDKKHCRTKIENECLNRELEKQFNEGLQSQILHDYYEDLACHTNQCKTSSEPHTTHQQYFVPATTETQSLKP